MKTSRENIQFLWIDKAENIALNSQHPIKVGAVIVKNGEFYGCGFNLMPRRSDQTKITDRHTLHAEAIAIVDALENYGPLLDSEIFITHPPCSRCCALIAHVGIKTVYFLSGDDDFMLRHREDHEKGLEILNECDIVYVEVLNEETVKLF